MKTMAAQTDQIEDKLELLVPINGLSEDSQAEVLEHSEMLAFKRGEFVFRQGESDDYAFHLLDGELEMYSDDNLVQQVVGGTDGARHPLAQLQPRQLSAKARTAVQLLRVEREVLDSLAGDLGAYVEDDSADWMTRLLQSELFSRVPAANIQRIFSRLDSTITSEGDEIISQGSKGDYYYIIQRGRCCVTRKTSDAGHPIMLAELGAGDAFGEEALVANSRRTATVSMLSDGELMRLTKADFAELIQKPLLRSVSFDAALAEIEDGAVWLDVRFPDEHEKKALAGSVNVPLTCCGYRWKAWTVSSVI
jgi:CRP-like cAMP-binding protein